jgi:hypothetical protein
MVDDEDIVRAVGSVSLIFYMSLYTIKINNTDLT